MAQPQRDNLEPHFDDVQSHYDLSDDFFRVFLDATKTYSCAFFERDDMSLEEAQIAKIDLSLGKLRLEPGMTLLDIGCGWGATLMRAIDKHDVNVIGLTLSRNQQAYVEQLFASSDSPRSKRVLLRGWEQFDEPVDRIVSIGAFEHFGQDRYDDFFKTANALLPDDGVMMLHTITSLTMKQALERGVPLTMELARFLKFLHDRDLSGRTASDHRDGARAFDGRGFHCDPDPVAAAALCEDAGHLGGGAAGPPGRGGCTSVRGGLRPVYALPDGLRHPFPQREQRRQPIHHGEAVVA